MAFSPVPSDISPEELLQQLHGLLAGESDCVANAANCSALLASYLSDINWLGFYFRRDDELVLGPFQGLPACVRIPVGRGVCGTAAASGETQVVPDVMAFPGHIACDAASRSEVVVPIFAGDEVAAVLDVDSPVPDRFTAADVQLLEAAASLFGELHYS